MSPADLFAAHTRLVDHMARKLGRHRVRAVGIELDDLRQVGLMALWDCAQRFDESRGLKFTTFAGWRIRGAILSELSDRRFGGRNIGDYLRVQTGTNMDRRAGTCDPFADVSGRERDDRVRLAVYRLPPRWRRVALSTMRERRGIEIAQAMGISKQRVVQLRRKGFDEIRRKLAGVA